MSSSCPACGAPGEGLHCAHCGAPLEELGTAERERAYLDQFHRTLSRTGDHATRERLIENAALPQDPAVLRDAGLRTLPLLDVDEMGTGVPEAALARLRAVAAKLRVTADAESERAAAEIEAAVARHEGERARASRQHWLACGGCLLVLALGVALAAWSWMRWLARG